MSQSGLGQAWDKMGQDSTNDCPTGNSLRQKPQFGAMHAAGRCDIIHWHNLPTRD